MKEKTSDGLREFDPEPWRGELLSFVRRMGSACEAEDVVQEAFLRALQSPPASHPRAWLYRVALNVIRDRRRSEQRSADKLARLGAHVEDKARGPFESASERELADLAWRAVEELSEHQRAALLLRIRRHMDYDEVALALDCSVATARQHFHLAVKAVRDVLAEKGIEGKEGGAR